jgi:uncharacterized protein DUF4157
LIFSFTVNRKRLNLFLSLLSINIHLFSMETFAKINRANHSRAIVQDAGGGRRLPAVSVLQRRALHAAGELVAQKAALPEEEPVQKKGGPEEELPVQGKFVTQLAAMPEEEPLQKKPAEEELPVQGKFVAQLAAIPEEEPLQKKPAEEELPVQGKFVPVQRKANNTGLPDNLKSGIENMSGHDLSDVKVHYNSSKPAQLNAHAYAQGTDIHVAPGQEQHLPHEAWHVVQQKQGRVQPTIQMKEGVPVNDDKGLESEADVMGGKAAQFGPR